MKQLLSYFRDSTGISALKPHTLFTQNRDRPPHDAVKITKALHLTDTNHLTSFQ